MVSVCLPSDALSQHLQSNVYFSYLGHWLSLHGCSSKVQLLLLTFDEGYLLMATPPDLESGVAPLGPPVPAQLLLLGENLSALPEAADGRKGYWFQSSGSSWSPVAERKYTLGCFVGHHNCQVKKWCTIWELWLSFIWGKMRTEAWEAASQRALRDCPWMHALKLLAQKVIYVSNNSYYIKYLLW